MIKKLMMLTAVAAAALGAWAATAVVDGYTWKYTPNGTNATIIGVEPKLSGDVTIPSKLGVYNVTEIGDNAFNASMGLNSVTIPSGVTRIGNSAFATCVSLTSVKIPNTVTTIGEGAFGVCIALKRVTIPSSVTSIGSLAFYECTGLASIAIPNEVAVIQHGVFHGCSSLSSVTLPANLTQIADEAFYKCSSLTSVTIPSKVTVVGDKAFYKCSKLKYVTMGIKVGSIGDKAFQGCSSLSSVSFYGAAPANVGVDAFLNCPEGSKAAVAWDGYKSGDIWNGLTVLKASPSFTVENGVLTRVNLHGASEIIIPDTVHTIGTNVFQNCYFLKSVTIPSSVTVIKSRAFSGCSGLVNAEIPDGVTEIGYRAFFGCGSLTSVKIPEGVTTLGDIAFGSCTNVTKLTLPQVVCGRNERLMDGLFYSAKYPIVTDLILMDNVTSIGEQTFSDFRSLKNLTIPNSVTNIKSSAFYDCTNLTTVTIPDSVTVIGSGAFAMSGKSQLVEVSLPGHMYYLQYNAFKRCKNLACVTMRGDRPTYIGADVFTGASANCIVRLPKGNTTYYDVVDGKWQGLTVVYYGGATPRNVGIPDNKAEISETDEGYEVTAKEGETLTEEDFDFGGVDKAAYKVDIASDGKSATVKLAEPQVDFETEEDKVADDPTGVLVDVDESEIAAKPTPASGEDVGALPVNTHKGLFYQASWGDDVGHLTSGDKVLATGKELNLGVIKQKGAKGFYKISVSEK